MLFETVENVGSFEGETEKKNVSKQLENRMIWIEVAFNLI